MERAFVTNPLTGRTIQVGGTTFNRLTFEAYDYINGELIRRESAGPVPPREYYYNILTGRRILACSRRYYELIRANWDIEDDYYLIPPWIEVDVAQELMNGNRIQDLIQRERRPVTYEQIMDTHRDTLASLNISLCRECYMPIKKENNTTEYCEECRSE
jgi:hypothetical protein